MKVAPELVADVDYVERHTTNGRMLNVCRGLREALAALQVMERRTIEAVKAQEVKLKSLEAHELLALLPTKVISQHCPICITRRKAIRRATARWRARNPGLEKARRAKKAAKGKKRHVGIRGLSLPKI